MFLDVRIIQVSATQKEFHIPDNLVETLRFIRLQKLAATICYQRGSKLILSVRTFMPVFEIENVFGKLRSESGHEQWGVYQ